MKTYDPPAAEPWALAIPGKTRLVEGMTDHFMWRAQIQPMGYRYEIVKAEIRVRPDAAFLAKVGRTAEQYEHAGYPWDDLYDWSDVLGADYVDDIMRRIDQAVML